MKRYVVTQNYNESLPPIGHIELSDDVPDEVIQDCVIGPEIRLAANGEVIEVVSFSLFPRVNTDIRPRS